MKHAIALLVTVLFTFGVWLTAHAEPGNPPKMLPGKVLAVSGGQVRILLYTRVAGKDAPGKVPDEMAQQAAQLTEQAKRMEAQGRAEEAQRLRRHIDELLRWRGVELAVAPGSTSIVAARRSGFDQIARGDNLRVNISTEENVGEGALPARATLTRDAIQIGQKVRQQVRRLPGVPRVRSTFFELVGEVTNTNPLTLRVGNGSVQLDTPPQFAYIQQTAITPRDIQPGQRLFARPEFDRNQQVTAVRRVVIMLYNSNSPFIPDEIGG